jgi:hypothetical protein
MILQRLTGTNGQFLSHHRQWCPSPPTRLSLSGPEDNTDKFLSRLEANLLEHLELQLASRSTDYEEEMAESSTDSTKHILSVVRIVRISEQKLLRPFILPRCHRFLPNVQELHIALSAFDVEYHTRDCVREIDFLDTLLFGPCDKDCQPFPLLRSLFISCRLVIHQNQRPSTELTHNDEDCMRRRVEEFLERRKRLGALPIVLAKLKSSSPAELRYPEWLNMQVELEARLAQA